MSFNIFEKHSHKYPFNELAFPIIKLLNLIKEKFDKVILQLYNISGEFNRKLEYNYYIPRNIPVCINPGNVKCNQTANRYNDSCVDITPIVIMNKKGDYKVKLSVEFIDDSDDNERYDGGYYSEEDFYENYVYNESDDEDHRIPLNNGELFPYNESDK